MESENKENNGNTGGDTLTSGSGSAGTSNAIVNNNGFIAGIVVIAIVALVIIFSRC